MNYRVTSLSLALAGMLACSWDGESKSSPTPPPDAGLDVTLEGSVPDVLQPDAAPDAIFDSAPDAPGDVATDLPLGPIIRTFSTRSVFGNTTMTHNYMLDGDMEFSLETAWFSYSQSRRDILQRSGGRCMSGLRCAAIDDAGGIVGIYVSPRTLSVELTASVSPPTRNCDDCLAYAGDLYSSSFVMLRSVSSHPNEAGWCTVKEIVPAADVGAMPAVIFEVPPGVEGETLVDNVVAVPSSNRSAPFGRQVELTAAQKSRLATVVKRIREGWLDPGVRRPTHAVPFPKHLP